MDYLDIMVAAVPTRNKEGYLAMARLVSGAFLENGALSVTDCWGSDVPEGKLTSFPMAVKCAADETVAVGWIVWPSKTVRDAGWEKVMQDPRMSATSKSLFDGHRMIFGGFEMINSVKSEG